MFVWGIGRGEAVAAYLEMGAVRFSSVRFVCANESVPIPISRRPSSAHRRATPSQRADRPASAGHSVRALKNREMERFAAKQREVADLLDGGDIEMAEAQLQIEHYWARALRRAVIDGDVETGSVLLANPSEWSIVRAMAAIIQELADEAAAAHETG